MDCYKTTQCVLNQREGRKVFIFYNMLTPRFLNKGREVENLKKFSFESLHLRIFAFTIIFL